MNLNSLEGKTVATVKVTKKSYGLPAEVVITTTDGHEYAIDAKGEDGGECGIYPGMNFYHKKPHDEDLK